METGHLNVLLGTSPVTRPCRTYGREAVKRVIRPLRGKSKSFDAAQVALLPSPKVSHHESISGVTRVKFC